MPTQGNALGAIPIFAWSPVRAAIYPRFQMHSPAAVALTKPSPALIISNVTPWSQSVLERTLLAITGFLLLAAPHRSNADTAATLFESQVAPIFEAHCVVCHGEEKQKGRLRLDHPKHIITGGNSGEPLLIPGQADQSFLFQLISGQHPDLRMPPKGAPLSQAEQAIIAQWINAGGGLPNQSSAEAPALQTDHWSFQPLVQVTPPQSRHPTHNNPIDAFVAKALTDRQLEPGPIADRRTLIRRLNLIALGLPPSPDQVDQFLSDTRPNAYQRLVDRTLNSPHYGERWGRHWLDIVRYADTNGYETNRERKTAYRYRDFVIDAFNQDRPYDQFILDQIAGDTVGEDVGTGFLVAGPYDIVKSPDINLTLTQRQDELADIINTTGTTFLGLTLGCARCHNHKFDPILQKDYYAIQAVFAGVKHGERPVKLKPDSKTPKRLTNLKRQLTKANEVLSSYRTPKEGDGAKKPRGLRPAVHYQVNQERFLPTEVRFVRFTIAATSDSGEPCIDEWEVFDTEGNNVALASHGTQAEASGTLPGFSIHKLEHIHDNQTGNSRSWISNTRGRGWVRLKLPALATIDHITWGRDRQGQYRDRLATEYSIEGSIDGEQWSILTSSADRLPFHPNGKDAELMVGIDPRYAKEAQSVLKRIRALEAQITELNSGPKAWVANFEKPPETHRLYRGEPQQPREIVIPDGLTVTGTLGMALDEPEPQRRRKLARWIADRRNPLTARVLVNRLWHYTFGSGLVATPSDFGVNGARPTHPELLDWLAQELIEANWSIKHVQRLILTSHTFQQASLPHSEGLDRDANARYLWRFPPRRLEAEAIRDSVLSVAGTLDDHQGGPGFYLHRVQVENVMHYFPKDRLGPETNRRMVYLFKIRQEQDAIFGAFDCPDGNQTIPTRSRSNTPLQALNLFNSPFILQQAEALANRLQTETTTSPEEQIDRAFQLFFARPPDELEQAASLQLLNSEGLPALCRALFNASEFLFVF